MAIHRNTFTRTQVERLTLDDQAARRIAQAVAAGHWVSLTVHPGGVLCDVMTAPLPPNGLQREIGKAFCDGHRQTLSSLLHRAIDEALA